MDFIFMLTRDDQTVDDCLELVEEIEPLGLRHIGFKDVGVDFDRLTALDAAIKATGAVSYMEVVSDLARGRAALDRRRPRDRRRPAARRHGGRARRSRRSAGAPPTIPFPGRPEGHPTRLGGSPSEVEAQAARFVAQGCAGCDLLAYRATEADPIELVRAARRGLGTATLIVAGSVAGKDRIRALAEAGADAFTIGTAVFNGGYNPRKGSIRSQLRDILADCAAI